MKYLVILLFLITPIVIKSDLNTFEQKLVKFRYSLYPHLKLHSQGKRIYKILEIASNHIINKKCQVFFANNFSNIILYRNTELEKFRTKVINYSLFQKYKTIDFSKGEVSVYYAKYNINCLYQLTTIEPTRHLSYLYHTVLSTVFSGTDFASLMYISNICGYKISTKRISKNKWTVLLDNYFYAIMGTYNVISGKYENCSLYKRK